MKVYLMTYLVIEIDILVEISNYWSLNFSRFLNGSRKSRCDGYDQDASEHSNCSIVLKLQKNDKIKFRMDGSGPLSHTSNDYTYIEGFLAVTLNE